MLLAACGSGTVKPKPAELPANVALLGVHLAWSVQLPAVKLPLQVDVSGDRVAVAASDGTVALIDARTGREIWRASAGKGLIAGVGSDGDTVAVVTRENNLVALRDGKVLWKEPLPADTYTPPLVAGRRVFVQTADRGVSAWDGASGKRLWLQQRPAEHLVLRRPGVLLALGDTLIVGFGGRLAGLDPQNGSSRWEVPIAAPRGTNDVERLVDLSGPASRVGDSVCARAAFAAIGCVDALRGTLTWTRPADGAVGIAGNVDDVYGTELNGVLIALKRSNGERAWQSERLKYRNLTAPLAVGRSLVIGEDNGTVHFLSRQDGSPLNRVTPDGSAIAATPVVAADTVVIVTQKGGVFGYRPQ